ncbi:MAG: PEGA domain-containing protein [Terracidiphilus sp.]|jgi:hypothetical protein
MLTRKLFASIFLVAFSIAASAAEPAQVVTWPNTGTPILRFTFNKFKDFGSMGSQRTFVTDVIAENLSTKLIPTQKFSVYVLDKKQVRIGEAWMQVDNLGPGQSAKFQISFNASGAPTTVSVLSASDIPRKVSLTVNSVPQGADLKVDGVDVGLTPKLISVGIGKHQLGFGKEGFNSGTFPLEIGPDDVSGGSISYELGAARYDTIVLRDGSVLNGDLDSMSGMDVVVRIGGSLQHFNRNQIKQIVLVEREPPSPDELPPPEPKP